MEQGMTVHEALALAATEPRRPKGSTPMGTHTFRIPDEMKEQVSTRCAAHDTTVDEFLRQCCKGLLEDFKPLARQEPQP